MFSKNLLTLFLFLYVFSNELFANKSEVNDFRAFNYIIGMSDDGKKAAEGAESSILQKLALREIHLVGGDSRALYDRLNTYLSKLAPSLRELILINRRIERNDFKATSKCIEMGICIGLIGFGFDMKVNFGFAHTPLMSFPLFGLKATAIDATGEEGLTLGAALSLGVESHVAEDNQFSIFRKYGSDRIEPENDSAEAKKKAFYKTKAEIGHATGGAFGPIGMYKYVVKGTELSQGFMAGLLLQEAVGTDVMSLKIPIKLPFYYFFYKRGLEEDLRKILVAFHTFDFAALERHIENFQNRMERIKKKFAKRGLILKSDEVEGQELIGILSSVSSVFHPKTLLQVSPKLVPESLRIDSCEEALDPKKTKSPLLLSF